MINFVVADNREYAIMFVIAAPRALTQPRDMEEKSLRNINKR